MTVAFSDPRFTWNSTLTTYNGAESAPPSGAGGDDCCAETLRRLPTRPSTLRAELLTLFKQHARIDWADDDALCNMYIGAAISRCEQWCQMPIAPATYAWEAGVASQGAANIRLPFRNTIAAGADCQSGFELLIAPKCMPRPDVWPVKLECGFTKLADVPDDIVNAIFAMALGLYEMRSNPEMQGIYAEDVMAGNLSRYWVPRV